MALDVTDAVISESKVYYLPEYAGQDRMEHSLECVRQNSGLYKQHPYVVPSSAPQEPVPLARWPALA